VDGSIQHWVSGLNPDLNDAILAIRAGGSSCTVRACSPWVALFAARALTTGWASWALTASSTLLTVSTIETITAVLTCWASGACLANAHVADSGEPRELEAFTIAQDERQGARGGVVVTSRDAVVVLVEAILFHHDVVTIEAHVTTRATFGIEQFEWNASQHKVTLLWPWSADGWVSRRRRYSAATAATRCRSFSGAWVNPEPASAHVTRVSSGDDDVHGTCRARSTRLTSRALLTSGTSGADWTLWASGSAFTRCTLGTRATTNALLTHHAIATIRAGSTSGTLWTCWALATLFAFLTVLTITTINTVFTRQALRTCGTSGDVTRCGKAIDTDNVAVAHGERQDTQLGVVVAAGDFTDIRLKRRTGLKVFVPDHYFGLV